MSVQKIVDTGGDSENEKSKTNVDLSDLKLRRYAEFETWSDFLEAVEEFQKRTLIKLTITTSKKAVPRVYKGVKSSGAGDKQYCVQPKFDYQYLKLTCKHYGSYRSTSKGIRPKQCTSKLMCPTYLYGSYDHCKERFVVKQMNVDCNHELRDEDVHLPKILRESAANTSSNSSFNRSAISVTSEPETPGQSDKKKYIRKRDIIKVPLESPATLIVDVVGRSRCNHEPDVKTCLAMSISDEIISSIYSIFATKNPAEQDDLILHLLNVKSVPAKEGEEAANAYSLHVSFNLPVNGGLVRVCQQSFLHALRVTADRVNSLCYSHYERLLHRESKSSVSNIMTTFGNQSSSINESGYTYNDESMCSENDLNGNDEDAMDEDQATSHVWSAENSLPYPNVKVYTIDDGFLVNLDCLFQVRIEKFSLEKNGKSLKVIFSGDNVEQPPPENLKNSEEQFSEMQAEEIL